MTGGGRSVRIKSGMRIACVLALLMSARAEAANEAAISLYGGYSVPSGSSVDALVAGVPVALDLEGGGILGGALTLRDGPWKFDLVDVSWRRMNVSDFESDLRFIDVLVNVWYGIFSWKSVETYVGGGAGYAYGTFINDDMETSDGFAWDAGAGVTWKLNHMFRFSPRYRAVGHLYGFGAGSGQVVTHEFTLGVELVFSDRPR